MPTKKAEKKSKVWTSKKEKWSVYGSRSSYALTDFSDDIIINNQQLFDLYRQNPDIRQAVKKKSQYIGKEWFFFVDESWEKIESDNDNKEEFERIHRILSNPTYQHTKLYFTRDLDITGELYLTPTYNPVDGGFNGIQIVDPRTVQKEVKNGIITGFVQFANYGTQGSTQSIRYTAFAEEATKSRPYMAYYQLEKNTRSEFIGMWLLEGIVWDAMSDLEASKRNYYVHKNGMVIPSMIIPDKDISQDEIELMKSQLNENYRGTKNVHKPLIGAGVEDIKQLAISPKDMEFINQRKLTTDKVASAFGVPKFILGYTEDTNLANGEGQRTEFIEGTVEPAQLLFEYIVNDFFTNVSVIEELRFSDWDKKIVFKGEYVDTDIEEDKVRIEKVKNGLLTINEARAEDDYEPITEENADKIMVSKNQVLLEDAGFDFSISKNEI